MSRGHTRRVMTGPSQAVHEPITDITDKVRVKVASHMRGAPVLQLPTMNDNSRSKEQVTTPAPRRRGLNSGMIHTADTTVFHKITWPHEVVYTSTGQPTEYKRMSVTLFIS